MKFLFIVKSKAIETLGVMYLSAVVKQAGHDARIAAVDQALSMFQKYKPDIVGYSILTGDQKLFLDLNRKLKKQSEFISMVGGSDPTFFPAPYDADPQVDVVIKGEAEQVLADMLLSGKKYPDLDSIPWPDRTDFPGMKIRDFLASRGCAHDCSYCLTGDTLILKSDSSVVPIKDIRIGDKILGIHDEGSIIESEVKYAWGTGPKRVWELELENGAKIWCSEDHRWLSDRGWKYTTPAKKREGQRPFLTTQNSIRLIDSPMLATPPITDDYRRGYLSGMITGDGHLAKHGPYSTPSCKSYFQHQFRLCLKDEDALERTRIFLAHFGISTSYFPFSENMNGIRTADKASYEKIKSLIEWAGNEEFLRGFLGGIYDAEGYFGGVIRISNKSLDILAMLERALNSARFPFVYDKKKHDVQTIRITGGQKQYIRFWQWTDSCILKNRSLLGKHVYARSKIISIRDLGYEEEMYDIMTSTKNFFANGLVSHNCYNSAWKKQFPDMKAVRTRSAKDVVNEVAHVAPKFAYYQDSCFGSSMRWMKEYVSAYKSVMIPYHCHLRPSQVNEERVLLLHDSNCVSVKCALETGSDRLRKLINRGHTNNEDAIKASKLLEKWGIKLILQNILGLPSATIEEDLETLEVNIRCKPAYAWSSIFQPYPKTELAILCEKEGWYKGNYSEIGDNFFDKSVLNISEEHKEQVACLQRIFAFCTEMQAMPRVEDLSWERLPKFVHDSMRKIGDKRMFVGVNV